MDLSAYSKRKVAWIGMPSFWLVLLIIVVLANVNHGIGRTIEAFLYCGLSFVILLPYLIVPVGNIYMLVLMDKYHDFLLGILGITGDAFTLIFIWLVAIIYIMINLFIVTATIVFLLLELSRFKEWQRWEKYRKYVKYFSLIGKNK